MTQNIDQHEVNKFAEIADNWWDPTGDFKPLHARIGKFIIFYKRKLTLCQIIQSLLLPGEAEE